MSQGSCPAVIRKRDCGLHAKVTMRRQWSGLDHAYRRGLEMERTKLFRLRDLGSVGNNNVFLKPSFGP